MPRSALPRSLTPLLLSLSLLSLLALPARAETLVVDDDGGPGVDFTTLQAAADAALPGDLLLIQAGQYAGALIDKGLALAAAQDAAVEVDTLLTLQDLPADQALSVVGLELESLAIIDCLGPVALDLLEIGPVQNAPALWVSGSHRVTLSRSSVNGQGSLQPALPIVAQTGAILRSSTIVLGDCDLSGGSGGASTPTASGNGTDGRPALDAQLCTLVIEGSRLAGGHGGDAWDDGTGQGVFGDGGDGAPALLLDRCVVSLLPGGSDGAWLANGAAGLTEFGQFGADGPLLQGYRCQIVHAQGVLQQVSGWPDQPIQLVDSDYDFVDPPPLLFVEGGLLGQSVSLDVTGTPGAQALVWASPGPGLLPVSFGVVPLLLDPLLLLPLASGPLDATGTLQVSLPLPAQPDLAGLAVHLQAGLQLPGNLKALSTSAHLVLR